MSNYKVINKDYSELYKNIKIVFISSEFNRKYTKLLEDINEKKLKMNGFKNIKKFLVPGALEIPSFLKKVIKKLKPDLVICFGVIIKGKTIHYKIIARESARGIMDISIKELNTVIINGILTCENEEQVKDRINDIYGISALNLIKEVNKLG